MLLLSLLVLKPAILFAQSSLEQPLTREDARHLYSRTGFGYSLAQHDQAQGLTRAEAIALVMNGFATAPSTPMPQWVNADAPMFWTRRDMSGVQRNQFRSQRDHELLQLTRWWHREMVATPSPQTERIVMFWHDLMPTSYHGINRQSVAMANQNAMFRQYGLGSFGDLLKALIRDPAMLNYLDNISSKKQSPNENLARELLERFSMGEGSYTEQTVKEAARALTGYSVSDDYNLSFRFEGWKHDTGVKTLFGKTGQFNGDDLIDLILEQPATARFIASKFWNLLVSDEAPPPEAVKALAGELRSNHYDLAQLYQSILETEAFWDASNRIARVKSPITYQIGLARSLEYAKHHWKSFPVMTSVLGMRLFSPPNVSGWDEGAAFTTAGRLKKRKKIIAQLLSAKKNLNTDNKKPSMMQNMMGDGASRFSVTMAAENYKGPAAYRIELFDGDESLWQSKEAQWEHGHNTQAFGRIVDQANMPWYEAPLDPDVAVLERATHVRVHFLNDAAADDGDRNLYVRGVTINGDWYLASNGTQQSGCVPRDAADAGNLYCNGYVDVPVNTQSLVVGVASSEPYRVGGARVRWGTINNKAKYGANKKSRLELSLESVKAEDKQWRNIKIALHADKQGDIDFRIDSYSCWPECFTTVDDCLWLDKIDGVTRTWVFPLSNQHQCHYNSLSAQEQRLVDAIWISLPSFIKTAAATEKDRRYKPVLQHWAELVRQRKNEFASSRYSQSQFRFAIDPTKHAAKAPPSLPAPEIVIDGPEQLQQQLRLRDISVYDLLLPGVAIELFPQLSDAQALPITEQLAIYSQHAVSHLY